MDRIYHTDQQPEKTANPAKKATTRGPRPWEIKDYIYQGSSTDDGRSSHSDPRLELAQQSYSQHQEQFDSGFITYGDDHGYGPLVFGSGATHELHTSIELGELAGGSSGESSHKELRKWLADDKKKKIDMAYKLKNLGAIDKKQAQNRIIFAANDYSARIKDLNGMEKGAQAWREEMYGKKGKGNKK
jgi:hypothetical protein